MKTIVKCSLIIAALGVLSACNKDERPTGDNGKTESIPTKITLSVNLNAGTRSLTGDEENGEPAENVVSSLEFYVFDGLGNLDPEVGRVGATPGNGYIKFTDGALSKQVIVGSGNRRFVALANINLGDLAAGTTFTAFQAKLADILFMATPGGDDHNSRTIPDIGFGMSGKQDATIDPNISTNSVSIGLMRLVSKINEPTFASPMAITLSDIQLQAVWGTDTEVTNDRLTFNPLGYVVINGISNSNVLFTGNAGGDDTKPKTIPWNTWSDADKEYRTSEFGPTGFYTNNYSGYTAAPDWFLNFGTPGQDRVYVYENKPGTKTNLQGQDGFDPFNVYAFIIKGELVVDGDNTLNKTRYWRVDLVHNDNYHIMRNASYHINITGIASPGQPTPEDAEEGPEIIPDNETSVIIDLIVRKWRINEYQQQM